MNHRISFTAAVVTAAAATVMGTGSQAVARDTCTESSVRCTATATGPYAEAIDALGGRTLAHYLADHMVHRLG